MTTGDVEAFGAGNGVAAPFGEGSVGAAAAAEGLSDVRPPRSLLDEPDWLAVCDIDVDAICGWQVWRALQADFLVEAATRAVYGLLSVYGVLSPTPPAVPLVVVPELGAKVRASTARHMAALAGLTPPDCPGPERLVSPYESELPKGTP